MHLRKIRQKTNRRIEQWDNIVALDMAGLRTKLVRRHDGKGTTAYHKPGSQNRRKQ